MVTPNFGFEYEEYLLRSTFSHRSEIRLSRDAQNVCTKTIVGTALNERASDIGINDEMIYEMNDTLKCGYKIK